MTGLLVHVEGETEESFVNEALAPYLYDRGFSAVRARLIGNVRQRGRRGGIRPWSAVRKEIVNHLKQDRQCVAATMVDYYGMPSTGSRAWPGRGGAGTLAALQIGLPKMRAACPHFADWLSRLERLHSADVSGLLIWDVWPHDLKSGLVTTQSKRSAGAVRVCSGLFGFVHIAVSVSYHVSLVGPKARVLAQRTSRRQGDERGRT